MQYLPWHAPKGIPRQKSEKRKLFITADEHYHHKKILVYQENRNIFPDIETHDATLQDRHNSVVRPCDCTIHVGDFCFGNPDQFRALVKKLNGTHFFMDGSHDRALRAFFSQPGVIETSVKAQLLPKIFEFTFEKTDITLLHYAMTKWYKSHYGSVHFFGHSHGNHRPDNRSLDIGVDCHNFYPLEIPHAIHLALRGRVEANPRHAQKTQD